MGMADYHSYEYAIENGRLRALVNTDVYKRQVMSEENKYTFENPEYRDTYRHTVSHILAQAVKRLYPEVKLAIGPSIENGFYYDFDAPFSFTQENLDALEAEMKKICKEKLPLERFELPRAEARKLMEEMCIRDRRCCAWTT